MNLKNVITFEKLKTNFFSFWPLVPDAVVTDILHKKIVEVEKDQQNWLVEGYPRTKVQSLSL